MAQPLPRLLFLYPFLFKQSSKGQRAVRLSHLNQSSRQTQRGTFHTSTCRRLEIPQQRYGAANEPPPHLAVGGKEIATLTGEDPSRPTKEVEAKPAATGGSEENPPASGDQEPITQPTTLADKAKADVAKAQPPQEPTPPEFSAGSGSAKETVLEMQPPSSERSSKPTHLVAPPYVHHFDTYTLVRNLQTGGFTQEQAVTAMKAVRSILVDNMGMADEGLVSKSDVENVSSILAGFGVLFALSRFYQRSAAGRNCFPIIRKAH